ncbi:MAG: ATP-binding cassette domain-containing protein [Oscillospiraceae bacterium]|jgi:ABC-2 type transport system ATP-binding protein|nr:ATP-binding cassette domain-containing protein [Oscillospiraceae bacterium]
MNIIHTSHLTKTFRRFVKDPGLRGSVKSLLKRKYTDKTAVDDFDLSVEPGEFVGLIGPNGAGKTTLVKMLTGIVAPSSGEISVLGYFPNKLENAFKMQYAVVMGQKSQLFFELTPADTFRLFKELYRIPDGDYKRNVGYFTELFGVSEFMDVQVRTLSLGERMKMELITALLHNPGVLFLDEPTIGLDAAAQRQIRAFLREVNTQKGTTILLTSHYMEDVRSLCPRSVVINGGKKLYDGSTESLFDAYQTHKKITVAFDRETVFEAPPNAEILERNPYKVTFMIPKAESGAALSSVMSRYTPSDVAVEEEDIGAVVERIYAGGGAL